MTPDLTNPRADRVRAVRQLAQRPAREKTGRMLVEGPQAVREAVRFAAPQVRDVYVASDAIDRWGAIVAEALDAGLSVHPCEPDVLARMSGDAQGILAVLERPDVTLSEILRPAAPGGTPGAAPGAEHPRPPRLVVVCEALADPGNAGTIIRAADAAGADGVVFTAGSVDVTSPKVIRSSAGSLFHVPVVRGPALAETLAALRGAGLTVLAADGAGEVDIETTDLLRRPTAWLMGNEAHGISQEARASADAVVSIPLRGHAESLNVAMAATIALYASSRAHARTGA